jgi:hypothetical protein
VDHNHYKNMQDKIVHSFDGKAAKLLTFQSTNYCAAEAPWGLFMLARFNSLCVSVRSKLGKFSKVT